MTPRVQTRASLTAREEGFSGRARFLLVAVLEKAVVNSQ